MKTETITNRDGDKYTFTELENGNVLWEGDFFFSRIGYPNDYTKAYKAYQEQGGDLPLDEFKKAVHEYDDDKKDYVMDFEIVKLVTGDTTRANMVDPSGGPYLSEGMKILGKEIYSFIGHDKGYEIVIKK